MEKAAAHRPRSSVLFDHVHSIKSTLHSHDSSTRRPWRSWLASADSPRSLVSFNIIRPDKRTRHADAFSEGRPGRSWLASIDSPSSSVSSNATRTDEPPAHSDEPFAHRSWRAWLAGADPLWFLASMATGAVVPNLAHFPYPAPWLHALAYAFWILNIAVFAFVLLVNLLKLILAPAAVRLPTSFVRAAALGPLPIALASVAAGLPTFYPALPGAIDAAFGLYWLVVALSLAVLLLSMTAMNHDPTPPPLAAMTGAWLLAFIPPIVAAAAGGDLALVAHAPFPETLVLTSFVLLGLGLGLCASLIAAYLLRLIVHGALPRIATPSAMVPAGPLGMGAYAVLRVTQGMARHLTIPAAAADNAFGGVTPEAAAAATRSFGVLAALALVSVGAFFVAHGLFLLVARFPDRFGAGWWACVFPIGAWTNAVGAVGQDLGSEGLKGVSAAGSIVTVVLWVGCAGAMLWSVGRELGPWNEKRKHNDDDDDDSKVPGVV